MKRVPKQQYYDFFIIASRFWLAIVLINYGWGKLNDMQFGVTEAELHKPLKELSLFRLSWYLADHEPFKSFIGICQILCGLLLVFRRTCIAGAFMSIPIWLNILVWDLTFMDNSFAVAFTIRISYYLLLTGMILYRYRKQVIPMAAQAIQKEKADFHYPFWAYLLLPLAGVIIECIPALLQIILLLVKKTG